MAEITPQRSTIQNEDVAFRRGVSEAILSKVGAQLNFVNAYQTDIKEWKLNGSYGVATGADFYDGITTFFYNSEIVGIFFYNGRTGTSGTTTLDIKWINAAGAVQGSIFSTPASINTSAANTTVGFRNLVTGQSNAPSGFTLPVLSKSTFLEGESVFLDLTSSMVSGQNCGITIFYRPIN